MTQHCGHIAIVGRPNVGKSTLLNAFLGEKLCITSRKPQTTRHAILGIHTEGEVQTIFVDTPGIHRGEKKLMNRMMNRAAVSSLVGVDLVVMVVEALHFNEDDQIILDRIQAEKLPAVLVINKIDKLAAKDELLPFIDAMQSRYAFKAIVPISAKKGHEVKRLLEMLQSTMPEHPFIYGEDEFTDKSVRFLCSELLREKIFRLSGQELPYSTTVEIEAYEEGPTLDKIHALIVVDKESHKRMIIGEKGQKLKRIATEARQDMERLLDKKVFLKCYCKVKSGWADDAQLLKQLGYGKD